MSEFPTKWIQWLACHTQEEIAEACECDQKTVGNLISGKMADLPNFLKSHPAAEHLTDFEGPIYNDAGQEKLDFHRHGDMNEIVKCRSGLRSVSPVFVFVDLLPMVSGIRKDRGLLLQPDNAVGIFISGPAGRKEVFSQGYGWARTERRGERYVAYF